MTQPTGEEEQELESIYSAFGQNESKQTLYHLLNSQLEAIHSRAQSLISLAAVVITVTGFSGRIIADTNDWAQALIILGIFFVAVAASIVIFYVFPFKWVTSYMHLETREWLLIGLRRRNRKSHALRWALVFMCVGMIFYLASISVMLAFPEATELSRAR